MKTLVLQSHTHPLPYQWIHRCIHSVEYWASSNAFDYLFLGDEIFEFIDKDLINKLSTQPVIASDLARIIALQHFLDNGYEQVVWCDADFLIFIPSKFILSEQNYALGREVWIQQDKKSRLVSYKKVHNAFMQFQQNNAFLEFYIDSAKRLLKASTGAIPPQFVGPKLLTAIHNIVQCPVLETAGMLSPMVINDIVDGDGPALALFNQRSTKKITAANLCSSLCNSSNQNLQVIEKCIAILLHQQSILT